MASIKTLLSASNKFQIVFKENLENHAIRWVTPWVKILTINNTINLFPYFFLYFFHPSSQLKLCVLETSFYMLAFPLFKTHYLWLNKWKTQFRLMSKFSVCLLVCYTKVIIAIATFTIVHKLIKLVWIGFVVFLLSTLLNTINLQAGWNESRDLLQWSNRDSPPRRKRHCLDPSRRRLSLCLGGYV